MATRLLESGIGPGGLLDSEWVLISDSLTCLVESGSWDEIIRLREMFSFLIKGETTGGMPLVMNLNSASIAAAENLNKNTLVARYLHDSAENYRRKGYHKEAIRDFERSAILYKQEGNDRKALESYYFSSLAYRALGKRKYALEILNNVLEQLDPEDPWVANPLEVLSWLYRDDGKFSLAEQTLQRALDLFQKMEGVNNIHAVQTLADLGEVISRQGRFNEAEIVFNRSLNMIKNFQGQYNRQEARTMIKYAEMLNVKKDYGHALDLLNLADDKIRGYGHYYDSMIRIELARAIAYFGLERLGVSYRKFRMAAYYSKEINLPFVQLIKFLAQSIILQVSPPPQKQK